MDRWMERELFILVIHPSYYHLPYMISKLPSLIAL